MGQDRDVGFELLSVDSRLLAPPLGKGNTKFELGTLHESLEDGVLDLFVDCSERPEQALHLFVHLIDLLPTFLQIREVLFFKVFQDLVPPHLQNVNLTIPGRNLGRESAL